MLNIRNLLLNQKSLLNYQHFKKVNMLMFKKLFLTIFKMHVYSDSYKPYLKNKLNDLIIIL